MENITDLLNIDTVNAGDVPTLAAVTELDGGTPIPNFPVGGASLWEWDLDDIIATRQSELLAAEGFAPAADDGLF